MGVADIERKEQERNPNNRLRHEKRAVSDKAAAVQNTISYRPIAVLVSAAESLLDLLSLSHR
jgi:hypothetical protein